MSGTDLLLVALAVALGVALGAIAGRARSAGAVAERDAALAERDALRTERDAAARERATVETRLHDSESERVRLTSELAHARSAAEDKLAMLRAEQ
jgi:hypothetical protein